MRIIDNTPRWCNDYYARIEYVRSWIHLPLGSNQRLVSLCCPCAVSIKSKDKLTRTKKICHRGYKCLTTDCCCSELTLLQSSLRQSKH